MPVFGIHFVLWKLVMIIGYITLCKICSSYRYTLILAQIGWVTIYTIIKHAWFLILYIVFLILLRWYSKMNIVKQFLNQYISLPTQTRYVGDYFSKLRLNVWFQFEWRGDTSSTISILLYHLWFYNGNVNMKRCSKL